MRTSRRSQPVDVDGSNRTLARSEPAVAVIEDLRGAIRGDVRADRLTRALYATDASIYQIIPDGVVLPRTVEDVAVTVRTCARHGVPLTARGAGTGLTGGAVNRGIQLDCSHYLRRILAIDPIGRTATVEPGVVLDELNTELRPHGLHFAPDVATSSRATLGGMIANNSCGARSILYGRTVDHVLSLDVVLSDGSICTWGNGKDASANTLARSCEETLLAVEREYAEEISTRYPKILRRNGGYALDRLRTVDGRTNPETIICGSEGTLCIVVGATLKLTPLPSHKGMIVAHFHEVPASLDAIPRILEHGPAAVELVDRLVLDAARSNVAVAKRCTFLQGDPEAILIIEMYDDREDELARRLHKVAEDLQRQSMGTAWPILMETQQQAGVWEVRRNGLGLLMSRPGDSQPYAFVEDTAVDPARLREYIGRFSAILAEERVEQAGYYAHASAGCLHVRPVLNLTRCDDLRRMRRIAERVSSLALEFGGTMTGEHGDGIVRSCWLEKMYGPRIIEAFRRIKEAFDPDGLFNPGKIVSPLPMTENLRYEATPREADAEATLDFGAHGGMAGLAQMCSGVGQCRQRLVGTMCPSYQGTGEEKHSTRARANALRIALSGNDLLDGLSDPAVAEVMDLCLSCKACKTECPTGVDMARLKSEWLHREHLRRGVPWRSRFVAAAADLAALGSRCAALSNRILRSPWALGLMERFLGLDRRMPPPRFAPRTFRDWFAQHDIAASVGARAGDAKVVYFVDTWANYYTPEVGIAAVRVLEALGYQVVVPPTRCCGRPAISKGLLSEAKELAEVNVAVLAPYAAAGIPIVGTEPSCLLTMVDEWPQLVRTADARRIAASAVLIESFVAGALVDSAYALAPGGTACDVLYHGHCHQKAMVGTGDALAVLAASTRGSVSEINSGCCGMAGSFGHEVEHYDLARTIGEERLFPAVRARGEARIAVSGFSCREHIGHHTGVQPRHPVEYMADALAQGCEGS